jgi:hypothetical protein
MKYNISIQKEDYGFITEAIKLRTLAILESFDKQVDAQNMQSSKPTEAFGPCSFASAPVKAEGEGISLMSIAHPTKKKPHWTQTAKGKKIMAARKRKGTK